MQRLTSAKLVTGFAAHDKGKLGKQSHASTGQEHGNELLEPSVQLAPGSTPLVTASPKPPPFLHTNRFSVSTTMTSAAAAPGPG